MRGDSGYPHVQISASATHRGGVDRPLGERLPRQSRWCTVGDVKGVTVRTGVLAIVASLAAASTGSAATLEVTRTDDPVPGACTASDCSLREAVRRANGTAGPDRIVLKARTYTLEQVGPDDDATAGDLDIVAASGRTTVAGKGAGRTTIDGNDIDRILDVLLGGRLTVSGVGLQDGNASTDGGAIDNRGAATVQRSAVRSNSAGARGGGLNNTGTGTLTVLRTTIVGNVAEFGGGGLWSELEGTAALVRSKVRGNRAEGSFGEGGGVGNQNESRMRISRSTISGNRATDDGGGIFNQNDARLTISRSTIAGNRTLEDTMGPSFARGGAIFNQNNAQLRVTDSTISGNSTPTLGGAMFTRNNAVSVFLNSTLSGNRADQGGALYVGDWATVRFLFTTIARNVATTDAGAIYDDTFPPIVGSPEPPFFLFRGALIAGNSAPSEPGCNVKEPGHWRSLGGNLEDRNSCVFTKGSDRRNANARLRRLSRNGGPTTTHALKRSSDAVNAAKKRGCPRRDQRGIRRPQGRRCDSGAYELRVR